ncbi:MAG TPA: adenylate/guanylate cyclase domain-containing protein [Solirubrobacteraceae bacterium]|jgi:adenylate cyclase|nr:adenylate/guanylate cyclase domain-containing protein [Solirubrobacteraceae bacterium]
MKRRRLFGSNRNLKLLMLALVALGATGLGIAAYATNLLRTLDLNTMNSRFAIRGNQRPHPNILEVKIDSNSLANIPYQWPFPRAVDGKVMSNIAAQHPKAIAFDVQFSQPSDRGQNDEVAFLNGAADANGRLILSWTATDPSNGNVQLFGLAQTQKALRQAGVQPANGLFPTEPGDFDREMEYSIGKLETFAPVSAGVAAGHKVKPFTGNRWIDFAGPSGTYPAISFSSAYYGTADGTKTGPKLPSNAYTGKIVVIGATSPVLQDIHPTPTDPAMPGPEVQANAIATVLDGFPLSSVPGWVDVLLIVVLAVAVPLASIWVRPLVSIGIAVALGIAFAIFVQLMFNAGLVVTFVYPLGALVLAAVGALAVQLVTEAFERIRTVDLFARFVPEDVVDEVLKSADGLRLGGIQREGTIMFTDLRGFTSFSESLTPAQVIEVLNHYLSEMSDAILDNGGTLVAYMGDGIFAVFGAPLEQPDHADRALRTAREMLETRLPRFNEWIRSEGLGDGFRMGIGLNSGRVMSGHVGSERRVEYAAVGDTTNTASRIEGMTKGTAHQLLLSDSTREALVEPAEDLVFVDEVDIRGRVARMKLWGLNEAPSPPPAPAETAQTTA